MTVAPDRNPPKIGGAPAHVVGLRHPVARLDGGCATSYRPRMISRSLGLALAVPLLLAAPLGCPADPEDPMTIEGACGEIVEACHTKDDGTPGEINDCHGIAHDEDDAACTNVRAMCIEICNAAPDVATGGYSDTEHAETEHESDEHGESSGGSTGEPGTTDGTTGSTTTDPGTTTDHGTTTSTDEPSCAALGAGCHDAADKFGMMCHDVGHEKDEAACAKIWDACREACGF
jgi:hypothetical protein